MENTDETILHAAARELKEETGLTATRVVRKVTQFTFSDGWKDRPTKTWLKVPCWLRCVMKPTDSLPADLPIRGRQPRRRRLGSS